MSTPDKLVPFRPLGRRTVNTEPSASQAEPRNQPFQGARVGIHHARQLARLAGVTASAAVSILGKANVTCRSFRGGHSGSRYGRKAVRSPPLATLWDSGLLGFLGRRARGGAVGCSRIAPAAAPSRSQTLKSHSSWCRSAPGRSSTRDLSAPLNRHREQVRDHLRCGGVGEAGDGLACGQKNELFRRDSPLRLPTEALDNAASCRGFFVLGGSGASTRVQL